MDFLGKEAPHYAKKGSGSPAVDEAAALAQPGDRSRGRR
jgi:hypothetical protein